MPKLPVFPTVIQSMAVFGLHFGKLCLWSLVPFFLGLGALGLATGLGFWFDPAGDRPLVWVLPMTVALLFTMMAVVPLSIRINQLAILGRTEEAGYMEMIFSSRGLRYFGYWVLVTLILGAGLVVAVIPSTIAAGGSLSAEGSGAMMPLGIAVSGALAVAFLVLTAPLNLVYPAVAVESEPSLKAAYHLGSGNKLRLFACIVLIAALFAVLSMVLKSIPKFFDEDSQNIMSMILMPVHAFITMFSYVTTTALPAVAYRMLSGLPEPGAEADAGPGREGGADA